MPVLAYAVPTTVIPGETIRFHVGMCRGQDWAQLWTARESGKFTISFRRISGASGAPTLGTAEEWANASGTAPRSWEDGCGWVSDYDYVVPLDWEGGVYEATIVRTGSEFDATRVNFVVRRRDSVAPVLVVLPTATAQAYKQFGGKSLY